MKLKYYILLHIVAALLFVSGCMSYSYKEDATQVVKNPRKHIFAYIHIDGSAIKFDVKYINLKRIYPQHDKFSDKVFYAFKSEKNYIFGNTVPGGYKFDYIEAVSVDDPTLKIQVDPGPVARGFKLNRPGIYFLGSYKLEKVKSRSKIPKIRLKKVRQPREREVLRDVVDITKGSPWSKYLQNKLSKTR